MVCGIDIVQISRMAKLVQHHERSLHRFFTDREIVYCQQRQYHQYASFAGIFAAKEALFKALGTGFRQGKWTDVEIDHTELGAPFFRLHGYYQKAVNENAVQTPSVSISHDGDYAIAQVIM